jgi:hypothetical protein
MYVRIQTKSSPGPGLLLICRFSQREADPRENFVRAIGFFAVTGLIVEHVSEPLRFWSPCTLQWDNRPFRYLLKHQWGEYKKKEYKYTFKLGKLVTDSTC